MCNRPLQHKLRLTPGYLALLTAMSVPVAAGPASAQNLLVGSGGNGGISNLGQFTVGSGGGGGIGGGGGGGGSGISGSAGGGLVQGGDGSSGSGSRGGNASGADGGLGGGSGTLGGQSGLGGGGGAGGPTGATGGGGSGGGGLGAGGGVGNGGAGGDGGSITGVDGATFAGTASQGAQAISSGAISAPSSYDYVGIGGGGGGAGKIEAGGAGSDGSLLVNNADLSVHRSMLIGGGGGGSSLGASGGRGGDGALTLTGSALSVGETLQVGGLAGGAAVGGTQLGGQGGAGTLTVNGGSQATLNQLVVGGGGTDGGAGVLNLGTGSLSFSGSSPAFTINAAGTLNIGDATPGAAAGGTIVLLPVLTNNGRINFNQSGAGNYQMTMAIVGSGSVTVNGAGTTVLLGNNNYTGGTTVSAGTLQVGDGGNNGSIGGSIINNASVVFNRAGILNYAGVMSGTGNISQIGTGTLRLTGSSTGTGGIYASSGTMELTGSGARLGSATSETVIASMADATLSVSNGAQLTSDNVGIGSRGTAEVTGTDTRWTANYVNIGADLGTGSTGELRVVGGGSMTATRMFVGVYSSGSALVSGADSLLTSTTGVLLGNLAAARGTLTVENGGTVDASRMEIGSGGGTMRVAGSAATGRGVLQTGPIIKHTDAPIGTVDFDGGVLRAATSEADLFQGFSAGDVTLGAGGLELDSAGRDVGISTVLDGVGLLTKSGLGKLTLSGANTYTGGTELLGGMLAAGAPQVLGTGALNVGSGAVLELNGYGQSVAGLSGAGDVRLGGATLAVGAGNQNSTFSGAINGTGGLRKQGTGTLVLSGNSTYTGATQINAGSLTVNGSIANSAITVGSGAILAGSGTVGATTVASGGTLSPGNSLGSLRVAGDFNLAAGGMLDYELGAPGSGATAPGASDQLQVDGNVTLDGILRLNDPAGTAGLGYYRLISYGGGLYGSGLQLGAVPASLASGKAQVVTEVAGHLDLRVGAPGSDLLQTWRGGDGTWGSGAANWFNDGGTLPEVWAGNQAVFLTPGGGTVDVAGTQSFQGLQFVADGFRLNGAGTLETRAGGSELRVLGGAVATIDTVISGAGGIDKTQGGTLVLNGANTYAGGSTVSAGVLTVSSDANLGAPDAGLSLNGGTLRIASAAYRGSARSLKLGSAGGALDLPADFVLRGVVSGSGALNKTGAGVLTLASDSSAYAGTATVSAGGLTLADGARLGGSVKVAPGATLAGQGTLGTATIAAGAVHAPGGDSIGVQSVSGDYVNYGTLRIDATPRTHDSVVVAGGVDITGAMLDLRLSPADASVWSASTGPYTLISKQSDGAVVGKFATVSNPLLFLDASVNMTGGDGNDVTLTLDRNDRSVASVARTPNQRAVASAIDSLPERHEVWRSAMLSNDESALRQALEQLSGDTHASVISGLMNATPFTTQFGLAQLRHNLAARMVAGAPSAQAGMSDAPASPAVLPRSGASPLWARMTGDWQRQAGDGNAPGADQSSTGVFLGGDASVGHGWRVGGALGYTDARLRPDQRTASAKTQSYTTALYVGRSFATGAGAFNLLAGAAYSWHDIDTRRQVRYGSMDQTLKADYTGNTTQLFAEAGYSMPVAPTVTLEPFVGLSWNDLRVRGFSESGGTAALSGSAQRQDNTSTLAGVRAQWAPSQTDIQLRGMLGWRHAYGSLQATQTLAFDQGVPFSVAGAPIARDAARVELGADLVVVRGITAGLAYGGEFGGGNRQNTGSLDIRWRF